MEWDAPGFVHPRWARERWRDKAAESTRALRRGHSGLFARKRRAFRASVAVAGEYAQVIGDHGSPFLIAYIGGNHLRRFCYACGVLLIKVVV